MHLPGFPVAGPGSDTLAGSLAVAGVQLRACNDRDLAFLRTLYRQTRDDELAITGWPEETRAAFADQQFGMQHMHFVRHFPDAYFFLLQRDGRDIGRYYLDVSGAAWHVVDIALLADVRGQGIGTALLQATRAIAPAVTLSVAVNNPAAMRLYTRLGFVDEGEAGGMHRRMRAS
ncbi:GNAT family N-acetyltransferase [Luteibacter sp. 9135]|uniref:GNAT family N-acetyltransferase n=1 Tax=Luteibacter sp. 9135 TaxID=1500893 RepID=UPI00056542C2|nr:GNAT family N-acetyltransferase [Luteibacter sp. 9135]